MLITKKPPTDQKLKFTKMGAKPASKTPAVFDVENAADAKKPGDAKEDAQDKNNKKKPAKKSGKPTSFYANKAAAVLATKK